MKYGIEWSRSLGYIIADIYYLYVITEMNV